MAVMGILLGVLALPILGIIEAAKMREEHRELTTLVREVKDSFRNDDLSRFNISSLPGEVFVDIGSSGKTDATTCQLTVFDYQAPTTTYPDNKDAIPGAWYARLAHMRGQPPESYALVPLDQIDGFIHEIAFNAYKQRRLMIVGPPEETEYQRYIILSPMFPLSARVGGARLEIPAPPNYDRRTSEYQAWFNAIYNHSWGDNDEPPAGWDDIWKHKSGSRSFSYAQRILAERIVQRRYRVDVQNHDANVNLFVRANLDNASVPKEAGVLGRYRPEDITGRFPSEHLFVWNSSAWDWLDAAAKWDGDHTWGILEGRRITVHSKKIDDSGASAGTLIFSFLLDENTTITVQGTALETGGSGT
jgi:hypothetical protein